MGSRAAAKAQGLLRYFTALPCKRQHIAERLASNGTCMECANIKQQRFYRTPEGKETEKRHRQKYRKRRAAEARAWREKNHDRQVALTRAWRAKHQDHLQEWARHYRRAKYRSSPEFKLGITLRNRLGRLLRGNPRRGSFVRDLGCSVVELRRHIEKQFAADFAWANWGALWELDHIRPLVSFDLTDRDQFLAACHYTNLRPLGIEQHRAKSKSERRRTTR